MSAAMEAGDESFVRNIPRPAPLSLDYLCAKCGKPVTNWEARIDPKTTKLHLIAKCHGETAEFVVFLGMAGMLFRTEGD